jgi:hypothetical protein
VSDLTAGEQALIAMMPRWLALDAVRARDRALERFLREELPGASFTAESLTAANALCAEFWEIWPHYLPSCLELVEADRVGLLDQKVAELNQRFAGGD